MFRLILGFILGVVASFYFLPYFYSVQGMVPNFSFENVFSGESQLDSNTINANPPEPIQRAATTTVAVERINSALSLASLRPPQDAANRDVLDVVFIAAQKDALVNALFLERLANGITNQEAMIILSAYGERG